MIKVQLSGRLMGSKELTSKKNPTIPWRRSYTVGVGSFSVEAAVDPKVLATEDPFGKAKVVNGDWVEVEGQLAPDFTGGMIVTPIKVRKLKSEEVLAIIQAPLAAA